MMARHRLAIAALLAAGVALAGACQGGSAPAQVSDVGDMLIPAPHNATFSQQDTYRWPSELCVTAPEEAAGPAAYLGELLVQAGRQVTPGAQGCPIRLAIAADAGPQLPGATIDGWDAASQGYDLHVSGQGIDISAPSEAGLYSGVQTLGQLALLATAAGNQGVPTGTVSDAPAYPYRGFMLDVARRFYTVEQVKRIIDNIALYHVNVLHLHMSDDQGWRLAVEALPELTQIGASTQVGWPIPSGHTWFYSPQEYGDLVAHAAARGIEVIPEIEGPGHVTALQASLPRLTCDGEAPRLYAGTSVGISQLCLQGEEHLAQVTQDLSTIYAQAAQEPGRWIHVGGDETPGITGKEKENYVTAAADAARQAGRSIITWHDLGAAGLSAGSAIQMWAADGEIDVVAAGVDTALERYVDTAVQAGAGVIMSPASRTYIDHKYDASDELGYQWAGIIPVRTSYQWDPATLLTNPDGPLVPPENLWGVEACLFSEASVGAVAPADTASLLDPGVYADAMMFPRLPAIAEVGWVGRGTASDWPDMAGRLRSQAGVWDLLGIGFHPTTEIWPAGTRPTAS